MKEIPLILIKNYAFQHSLLRTNNPGMYYFISVRIKLEYQTQ